MELAPTPSVDKFKSALAQLPQLNLQTLHNFSGGMYARTIFIPRGCALVGCQHKTDHINIVHGDIAVTLESGEVKRITGFAVLETKAGAARAGIALADTYWTTVCKTEAQTPVEAENDLVENPEELQTRLALGQRQAELIGV